MSGFVFRGLLLTPSFDFDTNVQSYYPRICESHQIKKLGSFVNHSGGKLVVVVVGLESSGSKLLTKLLLKLAFPEEPNYDVSGHGTYGRCQANTSPLECFGVMHLSLPYYDCFPDPLAEVAELRRSGIQTRIVIATRDHSMSLRSKLVDHQRDAATARIEQQLATSMIQSLINVDRNKGEEEPIMFSYETLMLLRGPYVQRLAEALHLSLPKEETRSSSSTDLLMERLGLHLKDGNPKWMTFQAAIKSFVVGLYRRLGFGARTPAFQ